jgi:hypothetical protein
MTLATAFLLSDPPTHQPIRLVVVVVVPLCAATHRFITAAGSFSGYTFLSGFTLPRSVYFGPFVHTLSLLCRAVRPFYVSSSSSYYLVIIHIPTNFLFSPKPTARQGHACMVCVSAIRAWGRTSLRVGRSLSKICSPRPQFSWRETLNQSIS